MTHLTLPHSQVLKAENVFVPVSEEGASFWVETMGRPRVLLIEDEYEQRTLFTTLLEAGNFHVVAVPSVEVALKQLEQRRFSCVVSDLMLPKQDGEDFLRIIRQQEEFEDLPVLILTASDENVEIPLLHAGADMFCLKKHARKRLIPQLRLFLNS